MTHFSRRRLIKAGGTLVAASAVPTAALWPRIGMAADEVKIGLLHSLSGTIAIAEAAIVDAEQLAIEEINKAGGVMGRKIVPVVEDGRATGRPTPRRRRSCCNATRSPR